MPRESTQSIRFSERLWDPQDLVRRLCNSLDLAERAVNLLLPLGYEDSTDSTVGVTSEKVVAETALLLLACEFMSRNNQDVSSRLQRIVKLLIPYARSEQVLINLCLNPGMARDYAFAHICLVRLGFPDVSIDKLLRLCLETEVAGSRERYPHRILEQEWLQRVWNPTDTPYVNESGLAKLTKLGHPMDVFSSTRDDFYSFTHAIMYVSDLGHRKVRLPRPKSEILADADAALACCLDQQDYDLCGEILLTWPYLGAKWSPSAIFAFRVLAHVEDVVGFLPAPLTRLDRYNALSNEERSRYAMATVYHTAYVMGLLCAASLRDGQLPPTVIPHGGQTYSSRGLLKQVDADNNRPHWRDEFVKLDSKSQDTLTPMLVTIALKRAYNSRDLKHARSVLAYALNNGIVNFPATRQAAELLKRFAAISGDSHDFNAE